jgi:dihydroflavonol-4-reductase
MRAFITGGSGFIGSHLIDGLLKDGWQVRALAHSARILQEGPVEVVRGDIADSELLRQCLKGTDVLFHLASALGSARISRDEFFRVNAAGTEVVLRAAGEAKVGRVVHCSSAGVLGAVKDGNIADESYPPRPLLVYDRAKLEGERSALRFAETGMEVVVVRPGWAYGPRDPRTFKLIKAIHDGRFVLAGRGTGRQTPVYIDDLVDGLLAASTRGARGAIYHLAGQEIMTVGEMARTIAAACGKRIPRFHLPLFPARIGAFLLEKTFSLWGKEPPLSRPKLSFFIHSKPLSTARARADLGFRPSTNFQTGIGRTVAWYKEQGWL